MPFAGSCLLSLSIRSRLLMYNLCSCTIQYEYVGYCICLFVYIRCTCFDKYVVSLLLAFAHPYYAFDSDIDAVY